MDMVAGGKGMLSKSMASVLSTLVLTTGANIPVNATNGEETNKTGIKSSIMEKVNYVIEKIGDAKRFVVKKGEEGFEKTSKILKEHPWIKPVLCVVIVLAVGSGTVFAINKHKEKNKNKVIDPVASPDLTADDEGEEGEKKEEEKKEEVEKKEEEEKQRDAIIRVLGELANHPEEVSKHWRRKTWKERYEFVSRKDSSITEEAFYSFHRVRPSSLTEEGQKRQIEREAIMDVMDEIRENKEESEEYLYKTWKERYEFISRKDSSITEEGFYRCMHVKPSELTEEAQKKQKERYAIEREISETVSKYWNRKTWKEKYEFLSRKNSSITKEGFCSYFKVSPSLLTEESERLERAVKKVNGLRSGGEGNQEGSEQAAAPEAAVSGEEGSQEGSEHVDSAEAAIADETGENVNSQGSGKREDKKIPIVNIPKASSSPVAVTVEYNNEKQLLKEMIKDTVETTQWLDKNGGFSDEESRDKYNGCVYILNDDGKTFEERKKAYDELQEMAKSFRPKSLLEGAFGWLRWK